MARLEYVLNSEPRTGTATTRTATGSPIRPGDDVETLAAELRRDLIPLGVWVVVRRPDEADAGLHGECSADLQRRIDSIVSAIMTAHKRGGGSTH